MNLISFLVYIPLQILFIPLAIVGVVLVGYKQIVVSKKLGVSQTAIEVLNGRWTMHIFGIREDAPTASLAAAVPNTSTFGLWLALFPLWVKYRISGELFMYPRIAPEGHEGYGDMFVSRTLFFDQIIQRELPKMEQFVLMGAGYDTRALRADVRAHDVKLFELDQSTTQRHKIQILESTGYDLSDVTFVEVDFSREDAFEKLVRAGFDPEKKTLFLWEGVTLYLDESDVRKTMQDVRENSSEGSVLLADIYSNRFLEIGNKGAGKKTLEATGEGLGFGMKFGDDYEAELRSFIQSESMEPGQHHFLGAAGKDGPFMVVTEMCVRQTKRV